MMSSRIFWAAMAGLYVSLIGLRLSTAAENSVAVLPFGAEGQGLVADARQKVVDELRRQLLLRPDVRLLDTPKESLVDVMFEFECVDLDPDCLVKIAKKYQAERILLTALEGKGDALKIDIKVFDAQTGQFAKPFSGQALSAAELSPILSEGLVFLFGAPPVPAAAPLKSTVQIDANVEGAQVRIGDRVVGLTPLTMDLEPGIFPVLVSKAGHRDVMTQIVVESGRKINLTVSLEPIAVVPDAGQPGKVPVTPGPTPFYKKWWFWTVVGGGLALAGAATGLGVYYGTRNGSGSHGSLTMTINTSLAECDVTLGGGTCARH